MWGGEIFVPQIPSYRVKDVAKAVSPNAKIKIVGIRPGEKIHEEMITKSDSILTAKFDDYYVIMPQMNSQKSHGNTTIFWKIVVMLKGKLWGMGLVIIAKKMKDS